MLTRLARRFLTLSWHERGLALQAALMFPLIDQALRRRGFRWTQHLLWRVIPAVAVADGLTPAVVSRVVDGTGRRLYRATCLRRSLLLWWLLQRRGISCELKIGAARNGEHFAAHAWVEWQGTILNDSLDLHQRYTTFDHWSGSGA